MSNDRADGATTWSGGWMWVPGNPLAKRAGIAEDPQQPRTYLQHGLGSAATRRASMPSPTTAGPWLRSSSSTPRRAVNEHARRGEDPAFGRGSTPCNRKQGDPPHGPNPCVAPIEHGPFYAVKVLPGSFGTFAGLKTDGFAQVPGRDDAAIEGLYAVGTDMASVMGGFYPSGGIDLGPAMTFGYIAGQHAARVPN